MKKESIISIFVHSLVLCFCLLFLGNPLQSAALASSYEKEFDGGFVTVEVSDIIVFSITVTEGNGFFCDVPQSIKQTDTYEISTDHQGAGYIQIDWTDFSGCGDLYTGQTAIGTMSEFPPSFNIRDSFIIYCGIWAHGDYFDINPGTPTTTVPLTTTTSSDSSSTTTSSTLTTSVNTTSTTRPTLLPCRTALRRTVSGNRTYTAGARQCIEHNRRGAGTHTPVLPMELHSGRNS